MIAVDPRRQNELVADPRAIQQVNFTANLDRAGNSLFLKKQKKLYLNFHRAP